VRLTIATLATLLVVLVTASPATADGGAFAQPATEDTATITVTSNSPDAVRPDGVAPENPVSCSFFHAGTMGLSQGGQWALLDGSGQRMGERLWRVCRNEAGIVSQGWVDVLAAVPGAVVAQGVVQQAVRRLSPPPGSMRLQPPQWMLVHFESWFSIPPSSWRRTGVTVSVAPVLNPDGSMAVPGVSATAWATPSHVLWTVGDAASFRCDGPGVEWGPGLPEDAATYCGFTPRVDSAGAPVRVAAAIHYGVTWSWTATDGSSGSGSLPTDLIRTTSEARPILEMHAVPVGNPSDGEPQAP
jgi:hypothetical protein